jgi:hypothetical protein
MAHSNGSCPYCSRAVWGLANEDTNAKKYTIKPTSKQWPQPEWADDNELAPHIRELKQYIDSEELRLVALEPTFSKHIATYLDICIREDPWLIRVRRTIELEMEQKQRHFVTTVTRELDVKYFDMRYHVLNPHLMEVLTINTDAELKQEYEKAKKEVNEATEKYICLGQGINIGLLRLFHHYLRGGERGLTSSIEPNVSIYVSEDWPKTRPEEVIDSWEAPYAKVNWVVQLQEWSIARPDGFVLEHAIPEDQLKYWRSNSSERGIEYTRQTYEWLKATMEWFFKKRGEKFQGRPFDRATTNLLEPCKPGGKCGYCKEEHRTGDCLLPWD